MKLVWLWLLGWSWGICPLFSQSHPSKAISLSQQILESYTHWVRQEKALVAQLDQLKADAKAAGFSTQALKEIRQWSTFAKFAMDEEMLTQLDDALTRRVDTYFPTLSLSTLAHTLVSTRMAQIRLLSQGLLQKQGPHIVLSDSIESNNTFKSLEFLQLQAGNRIGEIGAGEGWLAVNIGIIYPHLQYFINEIAPNSLPLIHQHLDQFLPAPRREQYQTILGNPLSTQLEGYELDVVLIQNSFHHFSYKAEMLASIRASLKSAGRLILIEEFIQNQPPYSQCGQLMYRTEFIQYMQSQGWTKTRETPLPQLNQVILEYQYMAF